MNNLSWRIEELRSSRAASREDYPITVYEWRKLLDIIDDMYDTETAKGMVAEPPILSCQMDGRFK